MNDVIPIVMLEQQIYDDYYKSGLTLQDVFKKYKRYEQKDIRKILGLYELSNEPPNGSRDWGSLPRQWTAICKQLNPKAWKS